MRVALDELNLRAIFVINPGRDRYRIHDQIQVPPIAAMAAPDFITSIAR